MTENPTWLPVVAVALYDGEGRWLMQQRPATKHHGGLWEFPGGKLETEELPWLALVREVEEELGIAVTPADLAPATFAHGARSAGGVEIVILLYTCNDWQGEPRALEGESIGWFTPEEIGLLAMPPLDRHLAQRLFAYSAG